MPKQKEDMIGKRFGKLVVLEELEPYISPKGKKDRRFLCLCDCTRTCIKIMSNLKRPTRKDGVISCGMCLPNTEHIHEKKKYLIGEKFTNTHGSSYTIIGYVEGEGSHNKRLIKFDEDGYEKIVQTGEIKTGLIKYYLDKTYFGVGCAGMPYASMHPLYERWRSMLNRCYCKSSPSYQQYGAKGVIVSEELLNFRNYIEIVSQLPHYEDLLREPQKWDIDKDLKSVNKIYSKDTITIMDHIENIKVSSQRKPVEQIDLDGNLVAVYASRQEAEEQTGIHAPNIIAAIQGKTKTAGGYYWKEHE